jgi:two-component system sensor kinase FixL
MQPPPEHFPITEFEELRRNLARAVAMLRRRGAAERMALREARTGHELLISVVNGTPEEIHVKDLDLRYVMVNRAALNNGPERRAEWQVLGKQTADLFPPELASHIEDADRRVLATGEATSFELDYLTPGDTSPRWLAMTIAPWQDVEGKVVGVVSVSRDVTPHRQAQVRLRKLQAELLRATRLSAMGAMASGLAHELNQPLAAATNYLNAGNRLLERSADGDTNALQAARGAVTDAAQQMLRAGAIVRRLRDFVDRGEVELQPESVEELLRETTDLAISDGLPENIGLELTVADNIGHVLVDRTQIGQVVLNLLRNAAEAIQSMEPPRQGLIRVSARLISSNMVITVQDNGPGLAPGIADRLFEPFVSSKRTGMGIGLAICRTIVEGHGGRLTAEMLPEGGMMFRIVLPVMMPQGEIG